MHSATYTRKDEPADNMFTIFSGKADWYVHHDDDADDDDDDDDDDDNGDDDV